LLGIQCKALWFWTCQRWSWRGKDTHINKSHGNIWLCSSWVCDDWWVFLSIFVFHWF